MAEFCPDCWSKINQTDHTKRKYVISEELELCEGCGQWKHTALREQKRHLLWERLAAWTEAQRNRR